MTRTLFVVDELFPVRSAPAVRIENFMRALPAGSFAAVGGISGEARPPAHYIGLPRPAEKAPLAFVDFLQRLGRRAVREARARRPDAIVLSVPKYELLAFAPALARSCRRLVLDLRDSLDFLDYGAYLGHFLPASFARPLGGAVKWGIARVQARALRAADVVTVANPGIGASIDHPRVVVLANGVDTTLFAPQPRSAFDGRRRLRLVYLGNFAEKDRFDFVLDGLAGLSGELEIHLVGAGRNKASVLARLHAGGFACEDHGLVAHAELPAILARMDLGFIFRAHGVDQSLPVSLFELAAMSIPSCVNQTGMMAELVRTSRLGFVLPGPADLGALVTAIRARPALLGDFGHLREVAVRDFSLRRTGERFAELLAESP